MHKKDNKSINIPFTLFPTLALPRSGQGSITKYPLSLMAPLNKVGFPVHDLAMMMSIALMMMLSKWEPK